MKPRFLFRVEGGGDIGLGHIVRSMRLAREVVANGAEVVGLWIDDASVVGLAVDGGETPWMIYDGRTGGSIDEFISENRINALVVDQTSDFSFVCIGLKHRHSPLLIAALDPPVLNFKAFDTVVSLVCHGDESNVDYQLARHHIGLRYALIRAEFAEFRTDEIDVHPQVTNLLVTFGGTDPSKSTLKTLAALKLIDERTWNLHVVIGPGFAHKSEVRELAGGFGPSAVVYEAIDDMERLMSECDLGVTSVGGTLMEMCSLGKPTITIAHNEIELRFASTFHEYGATCLLGKADGVSDLHISLAVVKMCNDPHARREMGVVGSRLIDCKGASRVAARLVAMCGENQ
jgi:UDP-2,4-diacetamido-2,4,6-trideoxy-beta-L-altropyranose hydrolase